MVFILPGRFWVFGKSLQSSCRDWGLNGPEIHSHGDSTSGKAWKVRFEIIHKSQGFFQGCLKNVVVLWTFFWKYSCYDELHVLKKMCVFTIYVRIFVNIFKDIYHWYFWCRRCKWTQAGSTFPEVAAEFFLLHLHGASSCLKNSCTAR